jgi:hypothetical protein
MGGYLLWVVLEITELAQSFGLFFSESASCVFILTKNGLGYILGDFFINLSGHPVFFRRWWFL